MMKVEVDERENFVRFMFITRAISPLTPPFSPRGGIAIILNQSDVYVVKSVNEHVVDFISDLNYLVHLEIIVPSIYYLLK